MNTGKTPRVHIGEREAVRYGKAGYKINDAGGTACLFGESGRKTIPDRQIYQWMHEKLASSFDDMTNLSKVLRQKLQDACEYVSLEKVRVQISQIDGTRKYLFRLADGNVIESVLMRYKHGNSVCISSQVGCRMAAVSVLRPWTAWNGTCARRRCWTRFIRFSAIQANAFPTWL